MKSKDEISQYAPWEEEKKSKEKFSGIPQVPRRFAHSKPNLKDQDFLEMYVLAREKDRLEKYGKTLGRRLKSIATSWKEAKSSMYKLQKNDTLIDTSGIEDLIKRIKEREARKKGKNGNIQKVKWDY